MTLREVLANRLGIPYAEITDAEIIKRVEALIERVDKKKAAYSIAPSLTAGWWNIYKGDHLVCSISGSYEAAQEKAKYLEATNQY